ncbi:MAG: hypothetical protein LBR44_07545 [Clostridiales Family XIII bacterium]|jgi:hypothetical protein|nr:hypothetical protein [Clostridiales Family XIII bacterium]
MGTGLWLRFPVGGDSQTSRERYEAYFRGLASAVPGWGVKSYFGEDRFEVRLAPFEEGISGEWEEGQLVLSARTNSAGPGYHAWLTGVLEGLGVRPLEAEDASGYWETHDFERLRGEMAGWLQNLSKHTVEMAKSGGAANFGVSLPLGFLPHQSGHFACCPLGYFERDFFEEAQKGIVDMDRFFIWPNRQADALFFKNAALYLLWCANNWLAPQTEEEHETIAATLACLDEAYALDPALGYPCAEWLELARLKGDEALAEKLEKRFGETGAATIGYCRGLVGSTVYGWGLTHDGKMHFAYDEDGTAVWWDDRRSIYASTLTVRFKDGVERDGQELLQMGAKGKDPQPFQLRNGKIAAAIEHSQHEENGESYQLTQLHAALGNELLILSVYYPGEAEREWAVGICASVTR